MTQNSYSNTDLAAEAIETFTRTLSPEEPKPIDYYDSPSGKFLLKNEAGRWLALTHADYKRHLLARGLSSRLTETDTENGKTLPDTDLAILDAQHHRDVKFHGPLCGRDAGFFEENGCRFLVTERMKLPEPRAGNWPTLHALLVGLFSKDEETDIGTRQLGTFLGWLKSSVEALRAGRPQQQQALAICGPADCGKSLLQHLLTDMLAGRSAKAERYFSGKTDFNADLFAAEHLILEDEHCSTRIADRMRLGANLKTHSVGTHTASLHAKNRTPVNIRPWWRISITLNDDPESMMILPPLDDHIADKIILLRASRFEMPMPVATTAERDAFRATLVSEIPAFLHWLIHEFEIPEAYADPRRYNVAAYHHPELAEALESLSPESELLDFLDEVLGTELRDDGIVEHDAATIESKLREHDPRRAGKLFTFRNACGSYLGRLAKKKPERVESIRTSSWRGWRIKAGKRR